MAVFQLCTYDVWGNEKDSFEVNYVSQKRNMYPLFELRRDRTELAKKGRC